MKKILIVSALCALTISCGESKEQSVEEIIESKDLSEIRAKKSELSDKQNELSQQIEKLDEAIRELDTERRMTLVATDTLSTQLFKHFAEVQGDVATDENIIIFPEYSGILSEVRVDEGDKVSKGQVLAIIDDGGLRNQLEQLESQARLAKTTYERQKRLWDQNIGSEIQFLEAQTNYEALESSVKRLKSQLAKTVVRAPFTGIIDEVFSEQGEVVNPGQNRLFQLISLDNMYIQAAVPENYLGKISRGTLVKVDLASIGQEFQGEVTQVSNNINPANRTFTIKISIPNKDGMIKPNQIATIQINDYTAQNAIVVPESSIQKNAEGESMVYLFEPDQEPQTGTARKAVIEVGYTYNDSIEVKSGLQDGDILITEGAKSLREGQEVKTQTSTGNE